MSSILISEPDSPGVVLIQERSEQIERPMGSILTFYRGASTHVSPAWKAGLRSISHSVINSIGGLFAERLSAIGGIERIFVRKDHDFFRIWVVIRDLDLGLEDQIYAAQLAFMDQFPDSPFDFAVLFRQGKDPDSIQPTRARRIYPSS